MKLSDLIDRNLTPAAWSEAENIPWNDPAFSERMLREHLSQRNDRASRHSHRIELQVRWLHEELLKSAPSKLLDLACGPGLYTSRLAELGHRCTGIDYSPASIAYAQREVMSQGLRCEYLEADIRSAPYGEGYDLSTFIHGEFNSYHKSDAEELLRRVRDALAPGGRMVVEATTEEAVENVAADRSSWYSARGGLFSDEAHLVLMEKFWDAGERASTTRFYIVNLETSAVEQVSSSARAYTDAEYREVFDAAGFGEVSFVPSMGDPEGAVADGLFVIVATR